MPAAFEKCVEKNGRVRRIKGPNKRFGVKAGEYVNICFLGKMMSRGHVHKAKKG